MVREMAAQDHKVRRLLHEFYAMQSTVCTNKTKSVYGQKKNTQHHNFFFTRVYRQKKIAHDVTIFLYTRLPQKKKPHNVKNFFTLGYRKKKIRGFTTKKKIHNFIENKKCMRVTNLPICGPLLILSPALRHWGPQDGRGYAATTPTCGPLLILSPALRHWGAQTARVTWPPSPPMGHF